MAGPAGIIIILATAGVIDPGYPLYIVMTGTASRLHVRAGENERSECVVIELRTFPGNDRGQVLPKDRQVTRRHETRSLWPPLSLRLPGKRT